MQVERETRWSLPSSARSQGPSGDPNSPEALQSTSGPVTRPSGSEAPTPVGVLARYHTGVTHATPTFQKTSQWRGSGVVSRIIGDPGGSSVPKPQTTARTTGDTPAPDPRTPTPQECPFPSPNLTF